MSTTFSFPAGVGVDGAVDSVKILDAAGAPTQVLDASKDYTVKVDWTVSGPALGVSFAGNWSVQLYVESMGGGYEGDLGPAVVQAVTASANNSQAITLTSATLQTLLTPPPAPGNRRVYKLVALVSHELFGNITTIAGFGEGPFFEVR